MSKNYRVNVENINLVTDEVENTIKVARIYGSGVLIDDMFRDLKKEYNSMVGKGHYGGLGPNSHSNLTRGLEVDNSNPDQRSIRVKPGYKVEQSEMYGKKGEQDLAKILKMVEKGWQTDGSKKMFRVAPDRKNLQGIAGGWMRVTSQKPKPFIENTLNMYADSGIRSANKIMTKAINDSLKKGGG